jgi:hypothetical protein
MKELLTAIIGKEEELKGRSEQTDKECQGILETGRQKAATLAEEYETKFRNEKDLRTREVEEQVKGYEAGLKKKFDESMKAAAARVNGAREKIKTAVINAILNG